MTEPHDCDVPAEDSVGAQYHCPECGDWWVAFLSADEYGITIWWERISA